MKNPFPFSLDNKRYHTLNYYYKSKFGEKLYKAVINCGFTCPNIDGSKGSGGCIFCDGGSGYFTERGTVAEQLEREVRRIRKKHENARFIAYFQANTNTYAPCEILNDIYDQALAFPNIAGISIGTRADCLPDDVLELLCRLNERTMLTVELGMQSVHEKTIEMINRKYSHKEFLDGYFKLKSRGIRVCLHIINGLPYETAEMMRETARQTAILHPDAVKLQMLHIINGTPIAKMYEADEFSLLTREEYTEIIADQLELLPLETVIERITGDGDKRKLIAPLWSADKIAVLGGIDKCLAVRDSYQGRLYNKHY